MAKFIRFTAINNNSWSETFCFIKITKDFVKDLKDSLKFQKVIKDNEKLISVKLELTEYAIFSDYIEDYNETVNEVEIVDTEYEFLESKCAEQTYAQNIIIYPDFFCIEAIGKHSSEIFETNSQNLRKIYRQLKNIKYD